MINNVYLTSFLQSHSLPQAKKSAGGGSLRRMSTPETFKCNYCDRVFPTKQGLTMHRTRVHNARTKGAWGGTKRDAVKKAAPAAAVFSADALIKAIYPGGIPARADVVTRLGAWLDEAEELTKLR